MLHRLGILVLSLAATSAFAVVANPPGPRVVPNPFNPLNPFNPFDFVVPEVRVLQFGNALEARPVVSADRKYVTLEAHAQNSNFLGSLIERVEQVPFFGNGRVVGPFRPNRGRPLFGAWKGAAKADGGKGGGNIAFDVTGPQPIVDFAGHPSEIRADRFDATTGALTVSMAYRLENVNNRRTASGRVIPGIEDHFIALTGALSEDGHEFSGRYTNNKEAGTFTVKRTPPRIADEITGAWKAPAAGFRAAWRDQKTASLTIRRVSGSWQVDLPLAHRVAISPLFWEPQNRAVVFQVIFQETATSAPQRGFINGCFSEDGAMFRGRMTVGSLVDGQADFLRAEP